MPLESRSRMVSFRLTLEEYERFRQLCRTRGLSNVSELVRSAVNHMLSETPTRLNPPAPVEARLNDFEERLESLTLAVASLQQSSSHKSGPAAFHQTASQ